MWKDLQKEWQVAFMQMWQAFCSGSTPIGAAIYDEMGKLVIAERNRAREVGTVNRRISHAEANALRNLDTDGDYALNRLVLYATMEPCPMCLGTSVMGGIRHIRYAARDSYCGSIHLVNEDPYLMSKGMDCTFLGEDMEFFQLAVQGYYELRYIAQGSSDKVFNCFETSRPDAIRAARELFAEKKLDRFCAEKLDVSEVFDHVIAMK